jgi:hypothetical protein
MRRRRSPWAWALARDTRLDRLRFARMATMTIIPMPARPMGITGRAILSAACSSAQVPGITAIMNRDITGVLTMVVGTTAVGTTAEADIGATGGIGTADAIGVTDEIGDMAIEEATEAGATATGSTVGEASTVVADSTVVMGSTAVVAGN